MNFSLVFPTRGRKQYLKELLSSINRTTREKEKTEILIAVDRDDKEDYSDILPSFKELHIKFFKVKRNENFPKGYYNFLAKRSKGKFIMALNDDAVFKTNYWDIIILYEVRRNKNDIVYIKTGDGETGSEFSCFPIISRKAFKVLGFFLNEDYYVWVADKNLYEIFRTVERIITINDVVISYKRIKDACSERIAELSAKHHPPHYDTVTEHAERLRQYINKCDKK